jgi:hypothetical protein
MGEDKFILSIEDSVKNGTYPPKPNPGGIRLKNIWKLTKPPYKPKIAKKID